MRMLPPSLHSIRRSPPGSVTVTSWSQNPLRIAATAEAQAADDAVWAYDTPHAGVGEIAGHVAFDPSKVTVAVD